MSNKIDTAKLKEVISQHIEIVDGQAGLTADGVKEALEVCDLTLADVKKSQNATTQIFIATLEAMGVKAIDFLAENKHVDSVQLKQKVGDELQNATVHRKKERTNLQTKEKFTNYGELQTSRTISAAKSQIADIKTLLKESAHSKLK